jgi:hypothetical protein
VVLNLDSEDADAEEEDADVVVVVVAAETEKVEMIVDVDVDAVVEDVDVVVVVIKMNGSRLPSLVVSSRMARSNLWKKFSCTPFPSRSIKSLMLSCPRKFSRMKS